MLTSEDLVHGLTRSLRDFRFGLRALRHRPLLAIVGALVGGLGIGGSMAVLGLAYHLLLGPLPFAEPNKLASLSRTTIQMGERSPISVPEFADWMERNRTFETLSMVRASNFVFKPTSDPALRLEGTMVSWSMLGTLGLQPVLGRDLVATDDQRGAAPVALISHAFWQRQFAGRADVLGTRLELDRTIHTVVGVLPPGLNGKRLIPEAPIGDVWVPISLFLNEETNSERATRPEIFVLGRLGAHSLDEGREDMRRVATSLEEDYPLTNRGNGISVRPIRDSLLASTRQVTHVLLAAAALVLLITIVNLGNLMMVQAMTRRQELATRIALGARRGQIARQLLAESLVLALAGTAVGCLLALAVGTAARSIIPPDRIDSFEPFALPVLMAIFPLVAAVCLCTTLPSLSVVLGNHNLRAVAGPRGSSRESLAGRKLRQGMVIAQIAIATALLAGAGLLVTSMDALRNTDTGIQIENLLTLRFSLRAEGLPNTESRLAFLDRLLARVEQVPGVEQAALTSTLPLQTGLGSMSRLLASDRPIPPVPDMASAWYTAVTPGYFDVMGIDLLYGRKLDFELDRVGNEPKVAVVSSSVARAFWPQASIDASKHEIGFELVGTPEDFTVRERAVVGVVDDVRHASLSAPPEMAVYVPFTQPPSYFDEEEGGWPPFALVVRGSQSSGVPLVGAIREAAAEIAPGLPLYAARTMTDAVETQMAVNRRLAFAVRAFAMLAMLLSAAGIYGVIAAGVAEERQEIGVRAALGAQPSRLLCHYLVRAGGLACAGLLIGIIGALLVAPKLLGSLLVGTPPHAPLPYILGATAIALCALAAALVPALRASRIPPTEVLRDA